MACNQNSPDDKVLERFSQVYSTAPSTRLPQSIRRSQNVYISDMTSNARSIIVIGMRAKVHDWAAIQRFNDEGHGFVACRKKFGCTHYAWSKAIRRGLLRAKLRPFPDRRCRYDWGAVQAHYDEGRSYRQCMAKFGFTAGSWHKARVRGEITTRPLGMPLEELLLRGGSRNNVKLRLLHAGLIENRCDECGISEWRGKPLSIHIDHVNGIRNDHRLENLRMLCPNCHSQTETYGGRNSRGPRQKTCKEPRPSCSICAEPTQGDSRFV